MMKRTVIGAVTLLVAGTVGIGARAQVSNQQTDRIRASAEVLADVRGEPDKDIPRDLWRKRSASWSSRASRKPHSASAPNMARA
jgi:hypothetical protein